MIRLSGLILLFIIMFAGGFPVSAQAVSDAKGASTPVIAPTHRAAALSDVMAAEWNFLKVYGEDKNEDVVTAVLPELVEWLKLYPDSEYAADAQLLKANIHLRLGDYRFAIVDLLKHVQEYPGAESNASARKLLQDTGNRKMDKKTALALNEIGKVTDSAEKTERLALFMTKLVERAGTEFYEPLVIEFREFFSRFPAYAGRDGLQLALGDLHSKKEEYISARLAYTELILVYPDSQLLVKAKRSLGDVLANNLKDYDGAITVYQDVAASYPGTDEAWVAYVQTSKLSERQKKYALAVETHEKIIALYPEKDAAYDSYKAEARILREEMSKYPEAIAVLGRLADKYKGEKALEALWLAAKIAKKDLKDLEAEVSVYDRIAAEYPEDPQAAKALFAAAEACENAKKFDTAKEYYGKVSDKYPEDSLAAKSKKRIDAIMNK